MRTYMSLVAALTVFTFSPLFADCIEGNCWTGSGTYIYPSGAKFTGQFRNGKINGSGTLYFSNGDIYTGEWHNHYRQGKGRLLFKNGNEYVGAFRRNRFHGTGTMQFNNGDRYTGNWVSNLPEGQGKYFFASGERYEGMFKAGKFDGLGTMYYTDGDYYTGLWANNKKHGAGTLYFSDGSKKTGKWANGNFQVPDTDAAAGSFVGTDEDGLRNCNTQYCQDGQGIFTYSDGSRYVGQFENGLPRGEGTVYYSNGGKYIGEWAQHAPHGRGDMYFANGKLVSGMWRYGKLLREIQNTDAPIFNEKIQTVYDRDVKIWAVIVGVGRYTHMPALRYTDDDAYQMYAFLKSPQGGALPDEQLRVLIDEDATRGHVLQAMRRTFLKADENDVVIFYFSGHGLEGSFLPVDFDGYSNRLDHRDLQQILNESKARHKVVLADACHSGSLFAPKAPVKSSLKKYYESFEHTAGGLALLMSSKSEEYSLEDGGLRSGIFSHFLIRGLKGAADVDNNQIITIQEAYQYVKREVYNYTAGAQTPTLTGTFDKDMPVAVRR